MVVAFLTVLVRESIFEDLVQAFSRLFRKARNVSSAGSAQALPTVG